MRILWTALKVVVGLAIAIPLAVIALAMVLGIVGAIVGIAVLALKLALIGLIGWGAFRLARSLFGGGGRVPEKSTPRQLAPADPYYDAALRELDRDLAGHPPVR